MALNNTDNQDSTGYSGDGGTGGSTSPKNSLHLVPVPGALAGIFYDPATGLIYDGNGTAVPNSSYDPKTGTYTLNGKPYNVNPNGGLKNDPTTGQSTVTPGLTPQGTTGTPSTGSGSTSSTPATGGSNSVANAYLNGGAPTFTAPGYTKPPAFSYGDFAAPDPNDLNKDPNFQYALKTQQDAIQKSAAARGVLNTGGTIYDLLSNANDLASTGYANLYNRDLSTYQTNRQNALDTYNTNYGTQYVDPYKYSYMGAQDAYNAAAHNFDLGQQYSWMGNLFDYQKQQDAFLNKWRLLSAV